MQLKLYKYKYTDFDIKNIASVVEERREMEKHYIIITFITHL